MSTRTLYTIALLFVGSVLGGCATSRSEIRLSSPAASPTPQAIATGRTVVIRSVKDERVFEQAPAVPSIPSLGFEGAPQASSDVKARAVARKRGGYGRALGDVLLEKGQTVAGLVRENLAVAFQNAGYRVAPEDAAGPRPLVVDVHIRQFWAWIELGFFAGTLNANIETNLEVSGGGSPTTINVHVADSRQVVTEGAWLEILEKALLAYREQAASRLSKPPF